MVPVHKVAARARPLAGIATAAVSVDRAVAWAAALGGTARGEARAARAAAWAPVKGILARGALPVISGGTGFYIKAFMEGLTEGISADPEVRETLIRELNEKGAACL